jgi:hypothetical protein
MNNAVFNIENKLRKELNIASVIPGENFPCYFAPMYSTKTCTFLA